MSATATRAGTGPSPNAIDRDFNRAWEQAHAHVERGKGDAEARAAVPVEMTTAMAYMFRTRPGLRRGRVHIDLPEYDWGMETDTKEGKAKALLLKQWKQRNEKTPKAVIEMRERAREANHGNRNIVFTPIKLNAESYFQTNDPDIANVIRSFIKSGEGDSRLYYEVHVGREILVGEKRFPDTATGTAAALAFMADQGGELKYVKAGTDEPYKASE